MWNSNCACLFLTAVSVCGVCTCEFVCVSISQNRFLNCYGEGNGNA